jgi:rRNA processing protein Gar1
MAHFPKFSRWVYLENKAKLGYCWWDFGPINSFYFSVEPAVGMDQKKLNRDKFSTWIPKIDFASFNNRGGELR